MATEPYQSVDHDRLQRDAKTDEPKLPVAQATVIYPQTPQQREEAEFRAEVRRLLEKLEMRLQTIEARLKHLETPCPTTLRRPARLVRH
jgi:hypothetical protein